MPLLGRRPSVNFITMLKDLLRQGEEEAKKDPNAAKVTLRKIHRMISDADPAERTAIEENKNDVINILLRAGELLFELNDKDKSIDYFEKVKEYDPKNVKAWFEIGRILVSQNVQIPYAIVNLKKAIELDPTNYNAMVLHGDIYRIRHENEESLKWYKESLKYSENKLDILNRILAVDPNDEEALKQKLNYFISSGMKEEASNIYLQMALSKNSIDLVDEGLKLTPNNIELLKTKARFLISMGRKSEAEQFIEKVEKVSPDDPELLLLKKQVEEKVEETQDIFGELSLDMNEPDENDIAIAIYDIPTLRKLLKNFGMNESFKNKLENVLLSKGRSLEIISAIEENLRDGIPLEGLKQYFPEIDGIKIFVSGDLENSEKFFNSLVQKDQKNAVAWYYKARIAKAKGNLMASKNFLTMALRLGFPKEMIDPSLLDLVS